jgi:hypothetical protein
MRAQSSHCSGFGSKKTMGAFRGSRQRPLQPARMLSLKGRGRKSKRGHGTSTVYCGMLLYQCSTPGRGYPGLSVYCRKGGKRGQAPPPLLKAFTIPDTDPMARDVANGQHAQRTRWHVGLWLLSGHGRKLNYRSRAMVSVSKAGPAYSAYHCFLSFPARRIALHLHQTFSVEI